MKLYVVLWYFTILQIINGKFIQYVRNASEPRNIHYLVKEVPVVQLAQNIKTSELIKAPVRDCDQGMKRDKNGKCRSVF